MTPGISNPGASPPGQRVARCVSHAPRVGQPGNPFVQGTDNAAYRAFVERTKFGQRGFGVLDIHLPERGFFSLRRSDGPAPSRRGRAPERPSQERSPPGLRGRVRSSRAGRTLCCGRGLRYRHVEPVLGVGHRSNRGRHVVLSIRELYPGRFGDRFDLSILRHPSTGSGTELRTPQAQRAFLGRVETGPALPGSSCPSVLSRSRPHRSSASANSAFNRSRTAAVSASATSSRASSSAGSP